MTKFMSAFAEGQAKVKEAQRGREEIYAVFQEAKNEILNASDSRISVEVANFPSMAGAKSVPADVRKLGAEKNGSVPAVFWEYWVVATNPYAGRDVIFRLAKWEQSDEGFPCTLTFDGKNYRCHNKQGLEETLATLFASTQCAEQFDTLLHM